MNKTTIEAPKEVLGSRMELSDLGREVFSGDLRLIEIWLPFNAHLAVGWGRVVSTMVVQSLVKYPWNQKKILTQISIWFTWKILLILYQYTCACDSYTILENLVNTNMGFGSLLGA